MVAACSLENICFILKASGFIPDDALPLKFCFADIVQLCQQLLVSMDGSVF